ncbi:hypothetical protein U1Q18_016177 [Sarracenia purpurea var. burkii]
MIYPQLFKPCPPLHCYSTIVIKESAQFLLFWPSVKYSNHLSQLAGAPIFPAIRRKQQLKVFELRDGSCKLSEDAATRSCWCFAWNKRSWIVVTLKAITDTNKLGTNAGHLGHEWIAFWLN